MSTAEDRVAPFARTVDAPDSATAQEAVKALAKGEGYRVRTVRSVRLVKTKPAFADVHRYRVELAVERA